MVRIRLQRHGKKRRPFYYLVVANQKAKRDGKFIEKIGTYNPVMQPTEIKVNIDRAAYWLGVGAQPSDTARIILSRSGALMRNHLNGGVRKGAFSQEEADKRFSSWMSDKENRDVSKLESAKKAKELALKKKIEEDKKKQELIEKEKLEAQKKQEEEASKVEETATEENTSEQPTETE